MDHDGGLERDHNLYAFLRSCVVLGTASLHVDLYYPSNGLDVKFTFFGNYFIEYGDQTKALYLYG